ncbi:gametocyte-specific factor 1 [Podargus strigoides]
MEPEALVQCPYDKGHLVPVSRLPYHLVKCQQNNPRAARMLGTCPFNARHRMPSSKLRSHITSCPDKCQLDLPGAVDATLGDKVKPEEVPKAWQSPPCQEDWEAARPPRGTPRAPPEAKAEEEEEDLGRPCRAPPPKSKDTLKDPPKCPGGSGKALKGIPSSHRGWTLVSRSTTDPSLEQAPPSKKSGRKRRDKKRPGGEG